MPLEAPQLDVRSFEDLLREARLRIPRYTPEWTDFNDSDPGITLVQLFAWLSEMMLFQMNKVPERNYVKFLQLLDMELRPARPARAYLTFTAEPGAARVDPVPRGTVIAAVSPGGGQPLLFETEEGLDLVPVPLTDLQVYDGSSFTVVTAANESSGPSFRPLGWFPQLGSALYLGFAGDDPAAAPRRFPQLVRLRTFLAQPSAAGPAPQVTLSWEYRSAQSPTAWRRLTTYRDDTAALPRQGDALFEGPPDAIRTTEGRLAGGEPRYWLRCRLAAGRFPSGQEPEIDLLRTNTVPASNLSTVREELLGISEGHPEERFELTQRPVAQDSLELWSEKDRLEPQRWRAVDDLWASGPQDAHFQLNATSGQIRFGDGEHGRIPVAGSRLVARSYRYGGGEAGNVGRGLISGRPTALRGVLAVTNERPAEGGRDEQTVQELKQQAPARLRHRSRAVTAEDFSALAAEVGGVARATTLPQSHPDFPEIAVPGAVTVVVVPDSRETPPRPSAELLRQTSRQLDRYRLLTTELHLKGPRYLEVQISARVVAQPFAAAGDVARSVHLALGAFLDPLVRDFGLDLYPTRFFEVLLEAEGVREVVELWVEVDGRAHTELSQAIVLPADSLVYGAGHRIDVVPTEDP